MSWAKIDDRANEHRKMLKAGAEACWLWACGLMYANRQPARDGFIPEAMLRMLYPFTDPIGLAEKLVEVKLWKRTTDGYQIHDFRNWNQTKEQRDEVRARGRERAAKSYASRKPKKPSSSPPSSPISSGEENPKSPPEESSVFANSSPTLFGDSSGSPTATHTHTHTPAAATSADSAAAPSLADRARRVLENPLDGQWQQPSKWPEVQAVAGAMSFGMVMNLRDYPPSDADLAAILGHFAAGITVAQLLLASERAKSDPYFKKLTRPGPAAFTAAVLRRLLADAPVPANDEQPYGKAEDWA